MEGVHHSNITAFLFQEGPQKGKSSHDDDVYGQRKRRPSTHDEEQLEIYKDPKCNFMCWGRLSLFEHATLMYESGVSFDARHNLLGFLRSRERPGPIDLCHFLVGGG